MSTLLKVNNLSLSVPTGHLIQGRKQVLDRVSFSVQKGSATAYLGPNGAGKTSTFRILCNLVRPDSGSVTFDGRTGIPPGSLGFMPEQPYFYKNLTPREMLSGFGRLSGMRSKQLDDAIAHWAERLHFDKVLDQKMSACSKGQVQRAGLAQALLHRPDFLLLDEPLSGLDPMGRECVRNVLSDEVRRGVTLLFSSHILADAEALCDQVIVLYEGKTAYAGPRSNLVASDGEWRIRCRSDETVWDGIEGTKASRALDQSWEIVCANVTARDTLVRRLLDAPGAELISVEPCNRTLEEAFMELLAQQKRGASA